MKKNKNHIIRQKCRENIIGFAPFHFRFGKRSGAKEGLLNISKDDECDGGNLTFIFIFDSNDIATDTRIHERMSRLDFNPLTEKGLLTALLKSAEFEQNENFAIHEFNFYFEKIPTNLPKLIEESFIPFFLERLYLRIGEVEWMPDDNPENFFSKLKKKLNF